MGESSLTREYRYAELLFSAAYLLCLIDAVLLGYSVLSEQSLFRLLGRGLEAAAAALILFKLYLDRFYPLHILLTMIAVGGVLALSYLRSGYNHLFYTLLLFLGLRGIDLRQLLRTDFVWKLGLVALIVVGSLLSVIQNYVTQRTGSDILRMSLGFNHPNTLAALVLSLVMEEALLVGRRRNTGYTVFVWALTGVLFLITRNRTAVLILLLFPLLLPGAAEKKPGAAGRLLPGLYPLLAAFSWAGMLRVGSSRFFDAVDRLLSNRLANSFRLYQTYGVPLFGQHVKLVSVKTARETASSIALLDVAYLRVLIQGGVLVLGVYAVMYAFLFRDAFRRHDRRLILVSVLFLFFGLAESGFHNPFMNFTLLCAAASVYRNDPICQGELK